jgi:sugar-specific transcriptional regulator TrmB
MIEEKLEKLGLSEKETKVYLAVLELGGDSVQNVAKKAGVHRATTYLCLDKLEELGLIITEKKGKKIIYAGQYPEKLLTNIIDEQAGLKKREVEIMSILPELKAVFNYSQDKPRVKFFEGLNGLKEVYLDTVLSDTEDIKAFISMEKMNPDLHKWLRETYVPIRKEKKIKAMVIAPDDVVSKKYQEKDKIRLRETKLVDSKKYPFSIEINIYGQNKVALMSYDKREMFGVIIESEEVHKTMKFIFQLVWDNLK